MTDSIKCTECGHFAYYDPVTDTDARREYDGRDVCVSCLIDLKLANGEYEND